VIFQSVYGMDDRVWFSKGTDSLLCATTGPWAHQSNYAIPNWPGGKKTKWSIR